MRITVPCLRLKVVKRTPRVRTVSLNSGLAIPLQRYQLTNTNYTLTPIRRNLLTLPDLSKLSPFGTNSPNPKKGGSNNDDCDIYHEKVILSFSKKVLFDIVSNVNEYKSFVPYCAESKVDESSRKQFDDTREEFLADLAIGYGQFRESYTSKVTIIYGKSVQAIAIPTPLFERLETIWSFKDISDTSTEVDFKIYYSFANPFYAAFAKTAIEKMTSKMIDAFKARAEQHGNVK